MNATTTTRDQLDLPGQTHVAEGPNDHTGMYVMHHAFRRDLRMFTAAAAATPLDDRDTWRALEARWRGFARILHHHHSGEDRVLWPSLLTRVDAAGDAAGRDGGGIGGRSQAGRSSTAAAARPQAGSAAGAAGPSTTGRPERDRSASDGVRRRAASAR